MLQSVYSLSVRDATPYATPDQGGEIVRIPGLHGTVRLWFDAGAGHPGHEVQHDLLFLRERATRSPGRPTGV